MISRVKLLEHYEILGERMQSQHGVEWNGLICAKNQRRPNGWLVLDTLRTLDLAPCNLVWN